VRLWNEGEPGSQQIYTLGTTREYTTAAERKNFCCKGQEAGPLKTKEQGGAEHLAIEDALDVLRRTMQHVMMPNP
jgi:hypothetical protein